MKQCVQIHVDGSIGEAGPSDGYTGIAAVARSAEGHFLGWMSRQLPPMTNNEAEYLAALLGLELAQQVSAKHVEIVSDSQVLVWQMNGQSLVHSQRLKPLHAQMCQAAGYFSSVRFRHVPREENQLADALATEALMGRLARMPAAKGRNGGSVTSGVGKRLRRRLTSGG